MKKRIQNTSRVIILSLLFLLVISYTNSAIGNSQNTTFAYVASLSSKQKGFILSKIDLVSLKITNSIFLKSDEVIIPQFLAIDNTHRLYIGAKSCYPLWIINCITLDKITKFNSRWEGDDFRRAPSIFWIGPFSNDKIYFYGSEFDTTGDVFFLLNPLTMEIKKKLHVPSHTTFFSQDKRFIISSLKEPVFTIYDTKMDTVVFSDNLAKKFDLVTACASAVNEVKREIQNRNIEDEFLVKCDTIVQFHFHLDSSNVYPRIAIYKKDSGLIYRTRVHSQKIDNRISTANSIEILDPSTGDIVDSIFFPEELVPAPSSFSGKELAQIDPIFEKFADREDEFPVVMGYGEISVSPDSKYIFWPVGTNIQNSQISYVIVINIKTKKVVKRIPVGDGGITNVVFGYE